MIKVDNAPVTVTERPGSIQVTGSNLNHAKLFIDRVRRAIAIQFQLRKLEEAKYVDLELGKVRIAYAPTAIERKLMDQLENVEKPSKKWG